MSKDQEQRPQRKRVVRGSQTQMPEAPAQRAEMQKRRERAKKHKRASVSAPVRGLAWVMKTIFKVLAMIILVGVITICIGGTAMTVFVMRYVDTESGYDLENIETTFTSNIYATDAAGQEVVVRSLSANGRREWIDISEIPPMVQQAFINAEDEGFFEHEGVEWMRTFAAFANLALQMVTGSETEFFSGGASTITQQLIKNINGDIYNRTPEVKMREILAALNLERNFTKEQILESYINYIYMGHNNYGVEASAQYYFGKTTADLTLVEAASLAAITQSPSSRNPIDGPADNDERRDWILDNMLDNGAITEAEHAEAVAAEVALVNYTPAEGETPTDDIFSYFEDAVIMEVIEDLMAEYNYTYDIAKDKVMGGGMQIYSTLDMQLQDRLDAQFADVYNFNDWVPDDMPDASMVIMNYEGQINAMAGSRDEKTTNLGFNPVTQGGLRMGSCTKPIAVYAPAWDQDLIYWSQIRTDEPKYDSDGNGTADYPANYGDSYSGNISVIYALRQSHNTIPVELGMELGIDWTMQWMQTTLGLSTIEMGAEGPSAILGSNRNGFNLDEFTAAFTIFGNGGKYTPPTTYTKVLDATGKVVLSAPAVYDQVIGSDTSYIMNKALRQVVTSGTGTAASLNSIGIEVAGKTGTTENTERSFVGMTPYHVASIWYGYHDSASKTISSSWMYSPAKIYRNIMIDLYEGYPEAEFDLDDTGVSYRAYCSSTGLMAGSGCPVSYGYFKDSAPIPTCNAH